MAINGYISMGYICCMLFPHFNIKFSNDLDQARIKGIRIFSSNAKMVYSSNTYQETIQVNNYSQGIYFIQIDFDNDQITKKLIIH